MFPLTQAAQSETLQLSTEQTVRRSLVHKRSLENVLLTELRAFGDNLFVCAGRLPTAHQFFNDAGRTPRKDVLFYSELGRQASIAISHAFLGVSPDEIFIFEGSDAAMTEAAWKEPSSSVADLVVVEVRARDITRRRNNAVGRVFAEYLMSIGNDAVFCGTGAWTIQPAALFHRLRRMASPRNAAAAASGLQCDGTAFSECPPHSRGDNVVISAPEYTADGSGLVASLIVNHQHPYFFDHPCDHVPGMLLLEGCAQAAMAAFARATSIPPSASAVGSYDVNFAQFVEHDRPITLTAQVHAAQPDAGGVLASAVQVTISQGTAVAGTATMRIASPVRV